MNYQKIHDQIVFVAMNRCKPSGYCELHHIVPRSHGGTNEKKNLIWLTPREHYLIHWILFKIHRTKEMAFAWYRMTHNRADWSRYTSHSFAYARAARSEAMSQLMAGKKHSDELKLKLSAAKTGKTYKQQNREVSPLHGRKVSEAHRKAIVKALLGRKVSAKGRENISKSKLGEKNHRFGIQTSDEVKRKIAEAIRSVSHKRESAVLIEIDGVCKTAAEWSRHPCCVVGAAAIYSRVKKGWMPEDAVFLPKMPTGKTSQEELIEIRNTYKAKRKELESKQ